MYAVYPAKAANPVVHTMGERNVVNTMPGLVRGRLVATSCISGVFCRKSAGTLWNTTYARATMTRG